MAFSAVDAYAGAGSNSADAFIGIVGGNPGYYLGGGSYNHGPFNPGHDFSDVTGTATAAMAEMAHTTVAITAGIETAAPARTGRHRDGPREPRPMNFRVQFLDSSALVAVELNADAHHAAGAIELAEQLDWPAASCACAFSMRTDARSTNSGGRPRKKMLGQIVIRERADVLSAICARQRDPFALFPAPARVCRRLVYEGPRSAARDSTA